MWFRKRTRRFATVLVGNVVRIPQLAGFADAIDRAGLERLTETISGIGRHEVVGEISRPGGGFRWEPHPVFAHVGVPPIQVDSADLAMVIRPGPATPAEKQSDYTIFLTPFEELDFWLKDLIIRELTDR